MSDTKIKISNVTIIGLVLVAIPSILAIISYDTEMEAPAYFTGKFFSLPIVICLLWVYLKKLKQPVSSLFNMGAFFFSIAAYLFTFLFVYGYVLLINDIFASNDQVIVQGKITDLYSNKTPSSNHTSYFLTVFDKNTNEEIKFNITASEFKTLTKGSMYTREWKKGFFGLLYR